MRLRDTLLIGTSIIIAGCVVATAILLVPPRATDPVRPAPPDDPGVAAIDPPDAPQPRTGQLGTFRIAFSRPKWPAGEWRAYLDGEIVAGKSELFPRWLKTKDSSDNRLLLAAQSGVTMVVVPPAGEASFPKVELLLEEINVPATSGEHKVEVAYRTLVVDRHGEQVAAFPYRLKAGRHAVKAGETTPIRCKFDRLFEVSPNLRQPEWLRINLEGGVGFDGSQMTWLENEAKKVLQGILEDPVYATLSRLYLDPNEFRANLRLRGERQALYVQLPEHKYGGPREFDADQLRAIVEWLTDKHWGWAPTGVTPKPALVGTEEGRRYPQLEARARVLERLIAMSKQDLQRLKGLPARLQAAKE
jgi:hypothetical protein